MVAGLVQAGFDEPLPLVASSERHLVGIINAWRASHPTKDIPGAIALQRKKCGFKHIFKKELAFVTTAEHVWVERFKISDLYMGWILKEGDGTCMMVRLCHGNGGGYRGYGAWLGGDLSFTNKAIAATSRAAHSVSLKGDVSELRHTKEGSVAAGES